MYFMQCNRSARGGRSGAWLPGVGCACAVLPGVGRLRGHDGRYWYELRGRVLSCCLAVIALQSQRVCKGTGTGYLYNRLWVTAAFLLQLQPACAVDALLP
jgi:hypothetical protein